MQRAWLGGAVVFAIVVGCGGKLAPTPGVSSPLGDDDDIGCDDCGGPEPKPTPAPAPTSVRPPYVTDAGVWPEPDPKPPEDGGFISYPAPNTRTWPCSAGAQVDMEYVIDRRFMSDGKPGTCKGTVQFVDDLDDLETADGYVYNGLSVCRSWEPRITGRTHCSTLKYASGRSESQYCTLYALCQNGQARATGFSW